MNKELKEQAHKEFEAKKQELKDWLYGTVYKGFDLEELSECVQEDVDTFFTTQFIDSLIDKTVQMTEQRIEKILRYTEHDRDCIRNQFEAGEPTEDGGYRTKFNGKWYQSGEEPKCDCGLDSLITNKSDINSNK